MLQRRKIDGENGETFKIKPVKPLDEIRKAALAAKPPEEKGEFRKPDLVDLATIDGIKFDIRYATDNNFLGTPFYTVREGVHAEAGRGGARSRAREAQAPGLRPAHLRRVPAVARHEDVLGRDAGEVPRLRRRPVEGFAAQPRLRRRSRRSTT